MRDHEPGGPVRSADRRGDPPTVHASGQNGSAETGLHLLFAFLNWRHFGRSAAHRLDPRGALPGSGARCTLREWDGHPSAGGCGSPAPGLAIEGGPAPSRRGEAAVDIPQHGRVEGIAPISGLLLEYGSIRCLRQSGQTAVPIVCRRPASLGLRPAHTGPHRHIPAAVF
jgi:hypothetical protein